MADLPTGTVTFLFTDIEGSTRLADDLGPAYPDLLDQIRYLVREVVAAQGGHEFGAEGDAHFLVFASPAGAVRAAVEAQRRLAKDDQVRVRVGIHTGEGFLRDGDYVGLDVHRVARIAAAGHGGQVLLSDSTRSLVEADLPAGVGLRDLGEHLLKDLRRPEHLFQLEIEGLPAEFGPLRGVEGETGNLPTQLTSFVGREKELADVRRLLRESRMLTLTGPGGTGKTRLSVRLASAVRDEFPGGAWFVPLASITDPDLVPTAVADAFGLVEAGIAKPPLERVIEHVRRRELLLVLDNFEQVLDAAGVVSELLGSAPRLKVVVTSRAVLHVSGEREFPVPPLRLPDPRSLPDLGAWPQYEAVALFIDRARAVKPDFEVTVENAPAVAEICARLDGLPLAIELAAARIRVLSADAILARMGDRLALLAGGGRDLPARQRTLREAIAWSYDLLEPVEQRLFARVAPFMGGWTLEEAEAACGPADDLGIDVLDGLASLAEKSLITVADVSGERRFGMLETIREFAVERLEESGEAEDIRRRHASAYLDLAELAAPAYVRREGKRWLERLGAEHDNLRAALEWAIDGGDAAIALRFTAALWRFWQMRGHLQEGRGWAARALGMPAADDHPAERARALEAAGGLAYWQADEAATNANYEEALQVAEEVGEPKLLADSLYNYSFTFDLSDMKRSYAELKPVNDRAMSLYEELKDRSGMVKTRWSLGNMLYVLEEYDKAVDLFSETLAEARQIEDEFHTGWSLFMLGASLNHLGRNPEARRHWQEALRMFADAGDLTGILFNLDGLADVEIAEGRPERGIRLAGAAAALRAETGADLVDSERGLRGGKGEGSVSEEDRRRAWAEGEAMTLEQAIAFALEEAETGSPGTSGRE